MQRDRLSNVQQQAKRIARSAARRAYGATPSGRDALKAQAALWVPPGHYYSPIPSDEDRARVRRDPHAAPLGIDLRLDAQLALLAELAAFATEWPYQDSPGAGRRYGQQNSMFLRNDAMVLHTMLRHLQPQRVVEVGSGWSTAMMLDTFESHPSRVTQLTCIEPYPDRLESILKPTDRSSDAILTIRREIVQDTPMEVFTSLGPGDILFVDSSHVAKAGSDVVHLYFEVFPRLTPGVIVHVHDIPWPFEYFASWEAEGRAWTEAYLLRALLMHSSAFEIMFWASQLGAVARDRFDAALPGASVADGGSIWIRRVS